MYLLAYALTLAYAALMYALGDFVAFFTILASFGSPIMLLYFALDWLAPPVAALACGYGARRSAPKAWLLGYPLVALITFVTPVASTKHQVLAVPVPWLAAYRAAKDEVLAAMPERLAWVSLVFLAAVLAGVVHRWFADRRAGAEGQGRSGAATAALMALPLAAAAATAGAWWTHEEGLWGANPRAPLAANFLPVVSTFAERTGQLGAPCVALAPDSGPDARRGVAGFAHSDIPGLGVATLPIRAAEPHRQAERDRALLRYEVLARAGYFTVSDTHVMNAGGEVVPARRYVMTLAGWEASENGCFALGRPEVLELKSFARIRPDPPDARVYEVVYAHGIREAAEWLASEDARAGFGAALKPPAPKEQRLRLVKGHSGWLPEPLVADGTALDKAKLKRTLDQLLPPLDLRLVPRLAVPAHIESNAPPACLLLPSRPGEHAVEIEAGVAGPYSATFVDEQGIDPQARLRAMWKSRLDHLAKEGVFRKEDLAGAARFVLEPQYLPFIDKQRPGCLRLGPTRTEYLRARVDAVGTQGKRLARVKGVAKVHADAWSRKIDLSPLPEAAAFVHFGVPVFALLELADGKWKMDSGSGYMPVAVAPPHAPQLAARRPPAAALATPRPADAPASVHVLAVYQSAGRRGPIDVRVGLRGRPVTLVLSAYEPVTWRIVTEPGAVISRVLVLGYHPARVEGVELGKLAFHSGTYLSFSSRRGGGDTAAMSATVARLVGRPPDSVQAYYEVESFSLGGAGGSGAVLPSTASRNAAPRIRIPPGATKIPLPAREVIIEPAQRR